MATPLLVRNPFKSEQRIVKSKTSSAPVVLPSVTSFTKWVSLCGINALVNRMPHGKRRRTDRMQWSWSYKRNEVALPNSFLYVMGAWRAPPLRLIVEPR